MKKFRSKSNILIIILIFFISILSFVSYHISYSVLVHLDTVLQEEKEDGMLSDKEVWAFLENLEDVHGIGNKEEVINASLDVPVEIAKENDKQDPDKEIKKNDSNKGVAKKTTAKQAVKKYETNETSLGIDISTWQGMIDWKKVKQSGISFAMIRVGFRRMDSGAIAMDGRFLANIKGAIANNINVGIYFFSMAKNSSEALEEARWVANVIKDYDITYPVAIDTEIFNRHRLKGVSYSTLTNNALVFCEYMRKMGYTPMIYSYLNAFNKYFDTAKFSKERIWLAQFNDKVTYKGNYHMWQYTSDGSVPGIAGRVDMDVAYFSVTNDVTKKSTVNGITNMGDLDKVEFYDMQMDTIINKEVILRSSPYIHLPNKAGKLEKNTKVRVTGVSDRFIRIVYNNDMFFINEVDSVVFPVDTVLFSLVDQMVKVNYPVTLLKVPHEYWPNNSVKNLEVGQMIHLVGVNDYFVKLEMDKEIFYVNSVDFYETFSNETNSYE